MSRFSVTSRASIGALALALAVGGPLVAATSAHADGKPDVLRAFPSRVAPHGTLHVSGEGCEAHSEVSYRVWSTVGGIAPLDVTGHEADEAGAFAAQIPLGSHFAVGTPLGVIAFCGEVANYDVGSSGSYMEVYPGPPGSVAIDVGTGQAPFGTRATVDVELAPGTPAGTVTLYLDGERYVAPAPSAPSVRFTLPPGLEPGSHELVARYTPASRGLAELTVSGSVDVVPAGSTTTLTTSWSAWRYGSTGATATARVSSVMGGHVRFAVDGVTVGEPVPVAAGSAVPVSVPLPLMDLGAHRVTADFRAIDGTRVAPSSAATTVKVTRARTKISVKPAKKKVKRGGKVTLRVKVSAPGVEALAGKIVVLDGKKKLRTVTLKASHGGVRSITVKPTRKLGKHKVKVRFSASPVATKVARTTTVRVVR